MSILAEARKYGIEFYLVGDTVKVRARAPVPPDIVARLRAHKEEIIRKLKEQKQADQYGRSKYPPKPQHRCPACKERNWWLSKHGLWVCRVCHPPAPGAEVDPETYRLIEQASNTVPEPSKSTGTRRWCQGYQPPRYVHTDVCSWHIAEGDVNCANCRYLTLEDKRMLMDSYLDKSIEKLNAHCAVYYKPTDPLGRRALIDDLERQITETYLSHNVVEFIKIVDKWVNLFLGGDNNAD